MQFMAPRSYDTCYYRHVLRYKQTVFLQEKAVGVAEALGGVNVYLVGELRMLPSITGVTRAEPSH